MFHLIWYILVGLIAGVIAKSVMHAHMTILWTIVLGIIGSIIGGAVTHMFSRPTNERYHPAYRVPVSVTRTGMCLLTTERQKCDNLGVCASICVRQRLSH
jgi:uncharacterized membrane protein YeaQ/YmgE (transglycosylase-associated protein family)